MYKASKFFLSNFFRLVNIMGCMKSSLFTRFPILYTIWYHGRIWSQDQTQLNCLLILKILVMLSVHPSRCSAATEVEYLVVLWGTLKYMKAGKKGLNSDCATCFNHVGDNYITYGYRERRFKPHNAIEKKPKHDRKTMSSITYATPLSLQHAKARAETLVEMTPTCRQ